ncbi:MAG: NAD(P)/FAD-dependent oxidoreductase, partial [Actinobacteria bacterium]|nr:NAD(P)/FAD-dependent oxidoreductase [Actinomycetota bacterium]
IERGECVGWSWRGRYDRLQLNTGKRSSHLPGIRYPGRTPTFPSRNDVVAHLETAASTLEIRFNTVVERVDRGGGGWHLTTSTGAVDAKHVVIAAGYDHTPYLPEWDGAQRFTGEVLHSSEYRNAARFVGTQVLVVGCGSSGMEIAYELATAGAARVWMAIRTPPNILLRTGPAGLPGNAIATPLYHLPARISDRVARTARLVTIGDLTEYGLPIPEEGPFSRSARLGVAPAIIDMAVVEAITAGLIEVVAAPASFDGDEVRLLDRNRVHPDSVICATGYRRGLGALVGHLNVLDERGAPLARSGEEVLEGLRFLGYLPRPSQFGYACRRARRVARDIAASLR